jgi:ADP-heptose:LPS heptosyltransferase
MCTPALRALRQKFPDSRIDFLTESGADQVLQHNPHLSSVIKVTRKRGLRDSLSLIAKLRSAHYSYAIDFNGLPSSALLCALSGARETIGLRLRGRGLLYKTKLSPPDSGYTAQHKLNMLRPLGIASQDCSLEFCITPEDKEWTDQLLQNLNVSRADRLITVSPVSRQPYKVWPPERFAQVADDLIVRHRAKVLMLYGPGEEHFVQAVLAHMRQSPLPVNYPMPTIAQTRALFERVTLHIGNDNGPAHFAIAAGTPVVTIFGRPWAENWSPPSNPLTIALEHDPGCKPTCHYPRCGLECLTGIPVGLVLQAIDQLIPKEHQQ